ncbi:hypothetical protein GCM10025868_38080 [Angustibacter aerolatus]|uniref:N-acetyltransferase domain-containing protein n=1 Tax=Angustibacter aerolatus TaxID=1162965 RepID=A0ABQ6JK30_9ACTN|nr:hypothetical protein GCM10025868_38080 [Angustibacter aerolatus]
MAEALVRACVDRARSEGRGRILLSTQTQMHAAQRLYGRLGFVRRPDLDWVPEPGVDLLGYEPGALTPRAAQAVWRNVRR